jgi:predicted metal-dependent phosphoesterase TrpH
MKPLKADLHIHTREDPEDHISYSAYQLIDRAFTKGFDVLAITNHQEVTYGQRLKSYAAERGIVLIPGVEATIAGKHVLLINMPFEKRSFTTFQDVQRNKAPNNLVVAPHPYFPSPTCLNGQLEATPEMFDAIEYCHFYSERINFNKPALRFAYKHRLPVVGNSDAHIAHQFGLTYSLVEAEKHPDAIIQAIKAGQVKPVSRPLALTRLVGIFMCVGTTKRFTWRRALALLWEGGLSVKGVFDGTL